MDFEKLARKIQNSEFRSVIGKIEKVVGMSVEATGGASEIGRVSIISGMGKEPIYAETVGFKDGKVILMPYETIRGIAAGDFVRNTNERLKIPVGECLIGRVVDAMGRPIDDGGAFEPEAYYSVDSEYINPLSRPPITDKLQFGVKSIDGTLTIGKGQRIGIFAGSGVGKSTLMGMIAKNVKADMNVIALVGERGREVREFIENDLGEEGLKRSVVVVATSDQPAMLRMKCALVATTIAEYFKDKGNDVLLMMDSLTRFAMAQREIGLAIGEPPVSRGYTPSIYAELPKLLERSGNFEKGSITGVYTVLVEGDDTNEPISDTVRGIVDGHIVLTRDLAMKNHYPAINVSASISRLMSSIVSEHHKEVAAKMRDIISVYNDNADLIAIGAYKHGTNPKLDYAMSKIEHINNFLKQGVMEAFSYETTVKKMEEIILS